VHPKIYDQLRLTQNSQLQDTNPKICSLQFSILSSGTSLSFAQTRGLATNSHCTA